MLFAQHDELGSARNSAEVLESDFHELDALRWDFFNKSQIFLEKAEV